ncbi:MAG: molybdenum cofactor guanylyltransferase, partial [Sphingopyxis sp.]
DRGPLGGIAGALRHARANGFEQLLSISVDCVRLPPDLRAQLAPAPAFLESQPVIGLWPVSACDELETLLGEDRDRSMKAFARRIGARAVAAAFVPPNINSPGDLDRLADL